MRGEKFKNTFFFASSLPPLPLPISSHFPSLPLPFFPTSLHFPFLPSILISLPSHSHTDPHFHLLSLTVPSAAPPPPFQNIPSGPLFPLIFFSSLLSRHFPSSPTFSSFLPLFFLFFTPSLFILDFDSSFFFPLLPLLSILYFFPCHLFPSSIHFLFHLPFTSPHFLYLPSPHLLPFFFFLLPIISSPHSPHFLFLPPLTSATRYIFARGLMQRIIKCSCRTAWAPATMRVIAHA